MKRSAILLVAGTLFLGSCNNTSKPAAGIQGPDSLKSKQDAGNLNSDLKRMDVPSQLFSAPGNQVSMIRGKKGTVLFLVPDDLETEDGQAPKGKIIVELKEITNQSELARSGAQTVSNGKLLVSGGAYYVNMTSGGKQLQLKKDRELKLAFPRITDSAMSLFYGQKDTAGIMNWTPTKTAFTAKNGYSIDTKDTMDNRSIMVYNSRNFRLMGYVGNDSTYKRDTASLTVLKKTAQDELVETQLKNYIESHTHENISKEKMKVYIKTTQKLNASLYDITNTKKLGWLNCDRFFDVPEKTNITYTINPKDSIAFAHVFLVYKEINSATDNVFYSSGANGTRYFENVPVGYKARLIAVTNRNNELLTCTMDMTISKNQHTLIAWKKTTTEQLNSYFDPNNNWGTMAQ